MKTINQKIFEERKSYLTNQSLVKTQLHNTENELNKHNPYYHSNKINSIIIGVDPLFEIDNVNYNIHWSYHSDSPTTFDYSNLNGISVELRNMTREESIELVKKYYTTEEFIQSLIEKNQEGINQVLSEVDNKRKMRKMYEEMGRTNTINFKNKLESLMNTENEYIELPRQKRFEEWNHNTIQTKWYINTKWVKYRFEGDKTWNYSCINGYTINGKVKKNYLMDLHDTYDGVIQNVLVTPKEFGYLVDHTIDTFESEEKLSSHNTLSCKLKELSNGEVDLPDYGIHNLTEDITDLMGTYSTFRVVFHEGDDLDHKFEVHEWNLEDQSWTFIKTYFLENYLSSHSITH